jgi:hypothetical protein
MKEKMMSLSSAYKYSAYISPENGPEQLTVLVAKLALKTFKRITITKIGCGWRTKVRLGDYYVTLSLWKNGTLRLQGSEQDALLFLKCAARLEQMPDIKKK